MAQLPVPGVAEFKIHGTVGSGVWDIILHFFGSPPGNAYSQAQLESMVTGFSNVTWTNLLAQWPATTTLETITATDLGPAAPAVYVGSPGFIGASGATQDGAACVLINYLIPNRYRGGKPRSYIPGMVDTAQSGPQTWAATPLASFSAVWFNAINAAAAGGASAGVAGCAQCTVQYTYTYTDVPTKHKYLRQRATVKDTPIIQSKVANTKITTQRRRLRAA